MYQQRQKIVSAMIFHMYQLEKGIKTHLVHQRVRISSLGESLYPVYDAIRCTCFNTALLYLSFYVYLFVCGEPG